MDLEWDVSMRVGPGRIFLPPAAHGWGHGLMERGEVEKMPRWLHSIRFKMQFVLVFNIFILLSRYILSRYIINTIYFKKVKTICILY